MLLATWGTFNVQPNSKLNGLFVPWVPLLDRWRKKEIERAGELQVSKLFCVKQIDRGFSHELPQKLRSYSTWPSGTWNLGRVDGSGWKTHTKTTTGPTVRGKSLWRQLNGKTVDFLLNSWPHLQNKNSFGIRQSYVSNTTFYIIKFCYYYWPFPMCESQSFILYTLQC